MSHDWSLLFDDKVGRIKVIKDPDEMWHCDFIRKLITFLLNLFGFKIWIKRFLTIKIIQLSQNDIGNICVVLSVFYQALNEIEFRLNFTMNEKSKNWNNIKKIWNKFVHTHSDTCIRCRLRRNRNNCTTITRLRRDRK